MLTNYRQKPTDGSFRWNAKRERAVILVAEDKYTDDQIADDLEIARDTLAGWKRHPDFILRVARYIDDLMDAATRHGVARIDRRMARLSRDWHKLQRVIDARAQAMIDDSGEEEAPGSSTGLLVRQERVIGTGNNAVRVVEYKVDDGLLSELRAVEKQAAQELGQWTERIEHTLGKLSDAELIERAKTYFAGDGAAGDTLTGIISNAHGAASATAPTTGRPAN